MNSNLIESFTEKSHQIVERATRLNQTLFEQFSKVTEMQLDAFKRYADLTMEQTRKVAEIRDMDDLKAFTESQTDTFKTLKDQFSNDLQAWQNYMNDLRGELKSALDLGSKAEPAESTTAPKNAKPNKGTASPAT